MSQEIKKLTPALDAYLDHVYVIKLRLDRLTSMVDDHFSHDPDEINWAHVGDLKRVIDGLDEILEIFGEKS